MDFGRTADAHGTRKKHKRQRVHDAATCILTMLEVRHVQCGRGAWRSRGHLPLAVQDQVHRPTFMDRRLLMPNSNYKRFVRVQGVGCAVGRAAHVVTLREVRSCSPPCRKGTGRGTLRRHGRHGRT